jgi:hypothetical protein
MNVSFGQDIGMEVPSAYAEYSFEHLKATVDTLDEVRNCHAMKYFKLIVGKLDVIVR